MRRGLSTVYGFIAVYLLAMAALEASSSTVGSIVSLQESRDRADQLESVQKIEHLTLTQSNGTLTLTNDGLTPSKVKYLHLTLSSSSSDLEINQKISVGQALRLSVQTATAISAVTSLGNVFWVSSARTDSGTGMYTIVFDATGVSSGSSQLLTIDGAAYVFNQLPLTFSWASGEVHNFAYNSGIPAGSGTRVGWAGTRGLATSQSGQLVVTQSGQVISDYLTQYNLAIVSGGNVATSPVSPTNDSWFNAGTTAYVTTAYVWDSVSAQSRQNLISWSVDGSTPSGVARGGSGEFTASGIVMNAPHTVTFNSVTQYLLQLQPDLSPSGTVPPLTVSYQYTAQSTVSQALPNPGFESGTLSPWNASCGYGSAAVSSATVHSGSYSAYSSYPNDAGSCEISQGFTAPPGASILSVSGSAYVYHNGVGTAWMHYSCGSYWGIVATAANSWQQVSRSDSCPSGTSAVSFSLGVQGSCVLKCYYGSAYWDDATFSYTYSMQYAGSTSSDANSYSIDGGAVAYQHLVSYPFPSGSAARQLQVTLPQAEALSQILVGSGTTSLPPSQYGVSGGTITIPESTIAVYGDAYTIVSSSAVSYSISQSGGPTGDDWYDSGTSATITATAVSPVVFSSWSGSPTLSSPSSIQTSVVMSSYYTVTGKFLVSP